MRVLLGIHLPRLPLDVCVALPSDGEAGEAGGAGCAVLEQGVVLIADAAARRQGVRAGMKRGGVLTLAPHTQLVERDPAREADALRAVALALLRFSPCVALGDEATLLVDVGPSLRLFGGLPSLCRQVRATLAALGYAARLSAAPTGGGAWLLARVSARARIRRRVASPASLVRVLDRLPCVLLPDARPYAGWFDGLGCRTLADLRGLPRAGLQRRCGPALLAALDRAYGDAVEPLAWMAVPPVFDVRLELQERVEYAEAVLFVARRLVVQLCGWLAARQLSLAAMTFDLEHERGRQAVPPTPLELAFASPVRDEAHFMRLLGERLARVELPAAVIAVRLKATRVESVAPPADDLFPEPGGTKETRARLIELLAARLGTDNVLRAAPVADHRPEAANRWLPLDAQAGKPAGGLPAVPPRPAWLLAEPLPLLMRGERPVFRTPLRMMSSPERIEAGWFDGQLVARDYHVAQDEEGACYWVFRERTSSQANPHWFLHGLFG
ncbi:MULTISPECIES: Y-family DNA polymerase [Burkholderia]|jgi:protein ImuB|uniref:DNA polymerase Y family protein n=3 Tax=Burkholderia TaxID=32008 RepID=A0A1R1VP23_9BURK|nr:MULTISPECIES: DNA polymerase Y family protein [Burkholderia]KKL43029.1 DNA polymerase [Burkholderia contaminans LMG 23361]MBA9830870.1 DNA polymerase Y family protein [Burkholderia contaminans]MBA9841013.1 DNA polymerase Y family protein [Burkholderia contaminans]MBA9864131.1 DNA polymerase Y family protein [Burkholderia contaminans]MBA9907239.1 DNA polymerase Y family protein [Burkholderia contaminans]